MAPPRRAAALAAVLWVWGARAQSGPPAEAIPSRTVKTIEQLSETASQTRSMLQSLLLANSQSMVSVTSMQRAVAAMRRQLELHDKNLAKCNLELNEFKSATKYSQKTWAEQHQINSVALLQTKAAAATEQVAAGTGAEDLHGNEQKLELLLQQHVEELQRSREMLVGEWQKMALEDQDTASAGPVASSTAPRGAAFLQMTGGASEAELASVRGQSSRRLLPSRKLYASSNGVPPMSAADRAAEARAMQSAAVEDEAGWDA